MEYLLLDSPIVRAHACAAGAQKKEGAQSLGPSRGGFSTKIHLACDGLGDALHFILTDGERHDITQAERLTENLMAEYVITDKGYDAEPFIIKLKEGNTAVVIPSRSYRKERRQID